MTQLVRTTALPVGEQLDYWHHLISESFVPLDASVPRESASADEAGFRGQLRGKELGPIQVNEVAADGHVVRRTPRLISGSERDYYKLGVQLRGYCLLTQDDREAPLTPGDFAIYDTTRPYTLAFDGSFRMLVLMFPRPTLGMPVGQVRQVTATRFSGRQGLSALVSRFLMQLAAHLEEVDVAGGVRLASNTTDLLVTALTERLDGVATQTDAHRSLLVRVMSYIEQRLDDPGLSPDEVAAVHHISTRYLYKLFREENTTVAAWIRDRRLAHCSHDLRDPAQAGRTVGAIAARWGFVDAAHFSRTFKSAFDVPPQEYRLSANPDGQRQLSRGPGAA